MPARKPTPVPDTPPSQAVEAFLACVDKQAAAMATLRKAPRLAAQAAAALDLLLAAEGPILIAGVGKSGLVGAKIAATWTSIGLAAVFVHASEAMHGDSGLMKPGAVVVLISHSGSTKEITALLPLMQARACKVIALTAAADSPLAKAATVTLETSVIEEADPLGVVPSSSTTITMVLGDALAAAVIQHRSVTAEDFLANHGGGHLGFALGRKVKDVMVPLNRVPRLEVHQSLLDAKIVLASGAGEVLVIDKGKLLGVLDSLGDRTHEDHDDRDPAPTSLAALVRPSALILTPDQSLKQAEQALRKAALDRAPVTDAKGKLVGLVLLQDVLLGG